VKLQHGADPKIVNITEGPLLRYALRYGCPGHVDYLLRYGADPHMVDHIEKSALDNAREPDFWSPLILNMNYLLQHAKEPNIIDSQSVPVERSATNTEGGIVQTPVQILYAGQDGALQGRGG
jgi:hypothetical protein